MKIEHTALIFRDGAGEIIDAFDVEPGHVITDRQLRALVHHHRAVVVERVTTVERRPQ